MAAPKTPKQLSALRMRNIQAKMESMYLKKVTQLQTLLLAEIEYVKTQPDMQDELQILQQQVDLCYAHWDDFSSGITLIKLLRNSRRGK
jgi:hypothetical protein